MTIDRGTETAEAADTAFFFYSGHGMEIGGANYLVPTDAELRTPGAEQIEAIDLSLVIESIGRARRLSVIVIDACRQGAPGPRSPHLHRPLHHGAPPCGSHPRGRERGTTGNPSRERKQPGERVAPGHREMSWSVGMMRTRGGDPCSAQVCAHPHREEVERVELR